MGAGHARHPLDRTAFIRANLPLAPVPMLPDLVLHTSHPGSGLWRLLEADAEKGDPPPPYWAYVWGGGLVLARYFRDCPQAVAGRRVLDLGAGSGIVAIAAAMAGAASVIAAETDANGRAALALNAAANGVTISILGEDLLDGPCPAVDLVAVGDLFYDPDLALRVTQFLDRCLSAGAAVLIGDPFRAHLPYTRLSMLAEYEVADVGDRRDGPGRKAAVFALAPAEM